MYDNSSGYRYALFSKAKRFNYIDEFFTVQESKSLKKMNKKNS